VDVKRNLALEIEKEKLIIGIVCDSKKGGAILWEECSHSIL